MISFTLAIREAIAFCNTTASAFGSDGSTVCSPPAVKGKPSQVGPVGDAGSGVCTITPDQAVFDSALLAAQHVLELRRLRVRLPVSSWNQLGFSADLRFSESHVRSLADAALGVAPAR